MPFMKAVAELVPASQPRVRRDFKQLMLLVRVHAVLHQQHRDIENGCIRATLDDYDAVRGTLLDQMAREEGAKVSDGVRAVVQWVRKQAERKQKEQDTSARPSWIEGSPQTGTEWHKLKAQTVTTTAASLAQALGISRSSAGQHAKEACELGYLVNRENRTKQPMQLSLDIPLPDSDDYSHLLPSREQVEQFMRKDGAAVEDAAPTYDWM
jgi:uncharacterized protein YidB (DUF937 family)